MLITLTPEPTAGPCCYTHTMGSTSSLAADRGDLITSPFTRRCSTLVCAVVFIYCSLYDVVTAFEITLVYLSRTGDFISLRQAKLLCIILWWTSENLR